MAVSIFSMFIKISEINPLNEVEQRLYNENKLYREQFEEIRKIIRVAGYSIDDVLSFKAAIKTILDKIK